MRNDRGRRGMALVLVMGVLTVLAVLGLAFTKVTHGLRRGSQFSYHRLQATAGLNNAILEARSAFMGKVNEAPVDVAGTRTAVRARTFKQQRREEVTARNREAFRRFMQRNRRAAGRRGDLVDDDADMQDDDERYFDRPEEDVTIPAHEWYDAFRERPDTFDAVVHAPFAERLMSRSCEAIEFRPVHVTVLSREPGQEEGAALPCPVVAQGTLAFTTELFVGGRYDRFRRTMEQRFRYRLVAMAPLETQDGASPDEARPDEGRFDGYG